MFTPWTRNTNGLKKWLDRLHRPRPPVTRRPNRVVLGSGTGGLTPLEDRVVPAAVRPGFDANTLTGGDDANTTAAIGFDVIFKQTFSSLFVSANGNVTFGSALNTFVAIDPSLPIIAPFFADVDRGGGGVPPANTITYGPGTVDGHAAFAVTWTDVGYYQQRTDKLNTFQVVLIDQGSGNFDIELNYDKIQWETGDSNGGTAGLGGDSAVVRVSDGTGNPGAFVQFSGSSVPGSFLDGNPTTGLTNHTYNSGGELGRYTFNVRNGLVIVNKAPELATIPDQTVDELTQLSYQAAATDDDFPVQTLTYSLIGGSIPAGAAINPTTGLLTWTPTEAQGAGVYNFGVQVTDGVTAVSKPIRVTVNEVNVAPTLAAILAQNASEGTPLTFTAAGSDTDLPGQTLSYSLAGAGVPATASINSSTGVFTWTPGELDGGTAVTFDVVVSDGTLTATRPVTITVAEVNSPPVLAPIGNKTVAEEALLTFTAAATDTDDPVQTLTYTLVGAPAGASIDPTTGVFTWTPTEAQGGAGLGPYTFTVVVTDSGTGALTDTEAITVTVNEVNRPPALAAIGPRSIDEGVLLTFTATATDPDLPANTLTYTLVGAPAGASITSAGVFTWTPTEAQGGAGPFTFTVVVSDGTTTDTEDVTVTVNEVNQAPVLAPIGGKNGTEGVLLTFTATATDPDLPANGLTYSLTGAGVPAGASIDASTGVFTWTPSDLYGGTSVTITVVVSDGTTTDTEDVVIPVTEVDQPPALTAIGPKAVDEGSPLTFTISGTDPDIPPAPLTYSAVGLPAGATFDPATGAFAWTPTEADGPASYPVTFGVSDGNTTATEIVTITVGEVNQDPVLAAIPAQNASEGTQLTFTAAATDADLPANTLTYTLVGAPAGASIDPSTGVFTWTPGELDGGTSPSFTVQVSDGVTTVGQLVTVTVAETNSAPALAAIGNKTVDEGALLTFTAAATDTDDPVQSLTFSLTGAVPAGASITSAGVFTWTPAEAQGPGDYTFTVVVTDSGTGLLTDTEQITVTVGEVNQPPVLAAIGNKSVDEGSLLTFTATATDPDLPANGLTFSLTGAVPAGASITSAGVFTWTPAEAQGPGDYTFTVVVTDGTTTDTEDVTVTVDEVNLAPTLAAIGNKTASEGATLTFTAVGSDPDLPANDLTYSLTGDGVPAGASINPTTGVFTWTPGELDGGTTTTFTVVVSDGLLTASEQITVTVAEVNSPPALTLIGPKAVDEGSPLAFAISGTDTDVPAAPALTYSATGLPAGATFDPATGAFAWTPTEAQGPASYPVTFGVSDGVNTTTEVVTITVGEVNLPPTLAPVADQTAAEGAALTLQLAGADPDLPANPLTYSLTGVVPPGASINPTTGLFRFVPPDQGVYSFTVQVSDGGSPPLTATVSFQVTASNVAPTAVNDAVTVLENGSVNVSVLGNDTDPAGANDPLTVTAVTDGAHGTVTVAAGGGSVTYTPAADYRGPDSFTYTVDDGDGGTATATVEVTVLSTSTGLFGYREFGVGGGPGLDAVVQLFNPDGTQRYAKNVLPGLTGGVRVSSADFNRDGIADLIIGTGPGSPTRVIIFDGKTEAVLFDVQPFEPSFTGGVNVAAGDVTADGYPELAISPDEGGGPRVRIFNGNGFGQLADFFGIDDPGFRGGARPALGDFNGDGYTDLVVAAGFGGGPRVAIYDGLAMSQGRTAHMINDFFVFEQTLRNGVYAAAGDLDGDGHADMIAGGGPGGGPRVYALNGEDLLAGPAASARVLANFFAGDIKNRGGIRVAARDLDGDQRADLVVGDGVGGGSRATGIYGKNIVPNEVPPIAFGFDAYPGYNGGIYVG